MAGIIFFNEMLSPMKIVGISLTVVAFLILLLAEIKDKKQNFLKFQIVIYYLITSAVSIANKKTIATSTPIIFSISVTILLALSYLILSYLRGQKLRKLNNYGMNKLLLFVGILGGITFLGVSYGIKLLPLGVLTTLLSSRVFFSIWISKAKYKEGNLVIKVIASILALVGIGVMFV